MTNNFELPEWSIRGTALLKQAKTMLNSSSSEKIKELSSRVPDCISDNGEKISLVFAGQYSAGKSSILKYLTGRDDISIGGGITTEETHSYSWNDITLIDSPGVHTEVRPDHDEITYRAIADSDLLVFVITNELFDSHLAKHFRKLAIDREKAYEMMLVVNKMQRCAQGNTPESQKIIRDDIVKVLNPFSPEDLLTSFIDAEFALESTEEKDPDISQHLKKKSGIESFINHLNIFVRDKDLTGRYSTTLYILEQILQEALALESKGDIDVDAIEELLLQKRRAFLEIQERISNAVEGEIEKSCSEIRHLGRKIADMINASADQKQVDTELNNTQNRVQKIPEELAQKIQDIIIANWEGLGKRVDDISNSVLAKKLFLRLEYRIKESAISAETRSKINKGSDISSKLGKFLIENSFNSKSGSFADMLKLNQYSSTQTHTVVKFLGNLFGKKFKPWEAVKWTKNIANAGRIFVIAGTILSFALQIKEDADEKKLKKELKNARVEVRSGFNGAAHEIEVYFIKKTQSFIKENFTNNIKELDGQIAELRDMKEEKTRFFDNLNTLLRDTKGLINDLHREIESN